MAKSNNNYFKGGEDFALDSNTEKVLKSLDRFIESINKVNPSTATILNQSLTRNHSARPAEASAHAFLLEEAKNRNRAPNLDVMSRINAIIGIGRSKTIPSALLSLKAIKEHQRGYKDIIDSTPSGEGLASIINAQLGIGTEYRGRQAELNVKEAFKPYSYRDSNFTGPMPPESFYGPTRKGATGYEEHMTKQRERNEEEESAKRSRLAASRSSSKNWQKRLDFMKEFPAFFKGTKMSAKDIKKTTKMLEKMVKLPVVGNVISMLAKHPVAGGVSLAVGAFAALNSLLRKSDSANQTVIDWKNATNLYGTPSKVFADKAFEAGVKDPGDIAKLYGALTSRFGSAEVGLKMMASTRNMAPLNRIKVAEAYGFDPTSVALADLMYGGMKSDKVREVAKEKAKIDVKKEVGYSSAHGFFDEETWKAIGFSMFGSFATRVNESALNPRWKEEANATYEDAMSKVTEANAVANTSVEYEKTRAMNAGSTTSIKEGARVGINLNGNVIIEKCNDQEELADGIVKGTNQKSGRDILDPMLGGGW